MTDFPKIIRELNEMGLNDGAIAYLLRVSRPSVIRWRQGGMPRHDIGEELKRIHALEVSKIVHASFDKE